MEVYSPFDPLETESGALERLVGGRGIERR